MARPKKSPALTWFYILVAYIFLQFGWWAFLMLDLNSSNTKLKTEITLLKSPSVEETHAAEVKLNNDLAKKRFMVIGEGTVFLILLSLGIIKVPLLFLQFFHCCSLFFSRWVFHTFAVGLYVFSSCNALDGRGKCNS